MTTRHLLTALGLSMALCAASCGHNASEGAPQEDTSNPTGNNGNNDATDELKGNHANTPAEPPATEYPGSGAPDTSNTKTGTKVNRSQTN